MKKKKKSMKCNDDADNAGDAYEKEKIMINYSEQKKKYEVDKRLQASSWAKMRLPKKKKLIFMEHSLWYNKKS